MRTWKRSCLILAVVLVQAGAVMGMQAQDVYTLQRISDPIRLDGAVDDDAWAAVAPLPLVMYEPVFKGTMTERTEIRVGHDDEYLYAAAKLYYEDVRDMRANSMYRDRYSGDDVFSIFLDTFNDQKHGLWFSINPNGVRMDYAISNDMEFLGGSPFERVINSSWNTFWDAYTTRTDEGWFAEVRIPFSSLGFQDQDGVVEMGMAVGRRISSKAELHVFPAIPPDWAMGWAKPSQYAPVRIEGASSRRPLYVTPYVAGGATHLSKLSDDEDRYLEEDDLDAELGIDLKYNITNNLTLDVTLNTDFAQAEADDQQVNLTRFPLFFPEKRQFFQERAGIFNFRTLGRFGRIFYSRRIGLHDGQIVPIIGGTRLVGRIGTWDVGLLNIQTAEAVGLPMENFGVYRVRRDVINDNSFVGAIATTRIGWDGTYNYVYGFDSQLRTAPKQFLTLKWAQVLSNDTGPNPIADASGGFARFRYERRTLMGLSYMLSGTWQGTNFEPGIGFLSRTGFIAPMVIVGYGWLASESSPVLSYQGRLIMLQYIRDDDRTADWTYIRADAPVTFKNGDVHTATLHFNVESFSEPLELPENTTVPTGRYSYTYLEYSYAMDDGNLLRTDAVLTGGALYDGSSYGIQLRPTWNMSRFFELGASYQFSRVRFPKRDDAFNVHIGRLRTQIGFTTKMSVNGFVQYNSSIDNLSANVRFRYNFREGNDLWLVFNEGRNTDRFGMDPVPPALLGRSLLLKYTYTFIR